MQKKRYKNNEEPHDRTKPVEYANIKMINKNCLPEEGKLEDRTSSQNT